jgi:hypothetical protein
MSRGPAVDSTPSEGVASEILRERRLMHQIPERSIRLQNLAGAKAPPPTIEKDQPMFFAWRP